MKRYMHDVHGFHIPLDPQEERHMLANGWRLDDGKALAEKLASLANPASVEDEDAPKRRGRPPKTEG